ncbi:MAG: hypothetical protein KDA25_07720, partial [Phycisphaerales bacterium]|nr:hypothetical protein [Phycisphaerales bacterium]
FELFTTVKGIGRRKALRALIHPTADVAEAIATNDLVFLTSLPEIGRRTAQTIVAELGDKVDRFIEVRLNDGTTGAATPAGRQELVRDALAVLTQLGETASMSRDLIQRALVADPTLDTVDAVVAATFRLKELPA